MTEHWNKRPADFAAILRSHEGVVTIASSLPPAVRLRGVRAVIMASSGVA